MASQTNVNYDAQHQEVAEVIKHSFAFVESLVIRSAIELHIPDIIHNYGHPITVPEIALKIESPSPDVTSLARIMRVLVRKKIFTINHNEEDEQQPLYGLTPISKRLLHDSELSLVPIFLTNTHPDLIAAWHQIGHSIKEGGGTPFQKAHSQSFWEKATKDPEFNEMFNSGMASVTRDTLDPILNGYKDGFSKLEGILVDVGGANGRMVAEIVKAHPHIKGINFDLSHVVATAPSYSGVVHVSGDMFKDIPKADNILIKSVLLDWKDEDCIKILKNCQNAVSEKKGKVVIIDIVLRPEAEELVDDVKLTCDLLMMVGLGGKARTEIEWKNLLNEAGFARYNIISIPIIMSIIEAFP